MLVLGFGYSLIILFMLQRLYLCGLTSVRKKLVVRARDLSFFCHQGVDSDSRAFQFAIRIDSLCESICLVKNRPFDSLVVMQFFLVYLLYSLSQKIS